MTFKYPDAFRYQEYLKYPIGEIAWNNDDHDRKILTLKDITLGEMLERERKKI